MSQNLTPVERQASSGRALARTSVAWSSGACITVMWILLGALSPGTATAQQSPMEFFISFSRSQLEGSGFTRHQADVAGQPMVWWAKGSGPTVVLVHGVADQAGTWFQVASELAKERRLLLVDLPGHGESGPLQGPLPMSTVVRGFTAWLTQHAIGPEGQPVVLVGNSMGAWVASLVAHRHPQHVTRMVAVNGGPLRADTGELTLMPKTREEARRLMAALRDVGSPATPDLVLDDLVRRAEMGEVSRMFAAQEDLLSHLLDSRIGEIKTPVDVLWGASDQYMGREYAQRHVDGLPAVRLTWLENCGHLPQAECPLALRTQLEKLLSQHPPGTVKSDAGDANKPTASPSGEGATDATNGAQGEHHG